MPIIRVALNVPVNTLFDYLSTDANIEDIGLRVKVPFGKKVVTGVILAVSRESPISPSKLKTAEFIFRDIAPLPKAILDLFYFCSRYYCHPIGPVILNGLPKKLRNNKPVNIKGFTRDTTFCLTHAGRQVDTALIPARNTVTHRLLAQLKNVPFITHHDIKHISLRTAKVLQDFKEKGWVTEYIPESDDSTELKRSPSTHTLTEEQQQAVNAISAQPDQFNTWLLHGITGSGKTEVYLQLIARTLANGKQTLILIPEISLTPQLENIFLQRYPSTNIISLHSGLNDTERLHGWLHAHNGSAKIILGTRLAIFTPLPDLGLVIVDEEQDSSFKQQDGLRYSARDIAIFRAKENNIPVILGSATPSLESYFNATTKRFRHIRLHSRAVKGAALPSVHCIDTRTNKLTDGLSQPLIAALRQSLANKQQSLVFINRRGYAPVLLCKSCHWAATCRRCSSRLVVHLKAKKLSCHYCGHKENFPLACAECGDQDLAPFGQGTQRVESVLTKYFPNARILRIDRDSISRKNAWHNILQAIHAREIDILVGTQLLAKGHDFPNLSLVGVLNSDTSLYSTDFRASERLFTQLMQVSGRAGRAQVAGQVLIQTEFPDHPLYHALQRQEYDALAQTILSERKIAGFPPYAYQALLRAEARQIDSALAFLTRAANINKKKNDIEMFDPVPAQMMRLKNLERAQLLVQSSSRKILQEFLYDWHEKLNKIAAPGVRWTLDVDPIEF